MAKRNKNESLVVNNGGLAKDSIGKTEMTEKNVPKKKNRKRKRKQKVPDEEVLLRDVIDLGGDKDDLNLITNKEKINEGNLDKNEFQSFFKDLGFDSIPENEKSYCPIEPVTKEVPKPTEEESKEESIEVQILKLSRNTKIQDLPKRCLIEEPYLWHDMYEQDPAKEGLPPKSRELQWLQELGLKFYENEVNLLKEKKESGKNAEWMQTVISSGTLPDKVTALSLTLKQTPVHCLNNFEKLLTIAQKNEKRVSFLGLDAIRELLLNDLIPSARRLRKFHQQPITSLARALSKRDEPTDAEWSHRNCKIRLILWTFEEKLKALIDRVLTRVHELSRDCLEVSKIKAMRFAFLMLMDKPEQEKRNLQLIVDKLGDPKNKVAAKALHMLSGLLVSNPMMQDVVVHEVRDLLFRPNLSPRSQYYCILFLNERTLSEDTKELAQKLVKIYLSFFKACTKKKVKQDKMLGALLTGVSRAFPYADTAEKDVAEEINLLFKTVHLTNLNTTTRALQVLYQVYNARDEISDRFYNALYASLMHKKLPKSTKLHPMFLNLVCKALKSDPCEARVQAIIKRLLQVCSLQLPPFTAASLVLVRHLTKLRPSLNYSLLTTSKSHQLTAPTAAAAASKSGADPLSKFDEDDDDDEEHFVDVKGESDAEDCNGEDDEETKKSIKSAWVHNHSAAMRKKNNSKKSTADDKEEAPSYNPLHRNPQFASAESTPLWELHTLARHYHPTVAKYARNQLALNNLGDDVEGDDVNESDYNGDPLNDYTLLKFLDRFVYRNPKKSEKWVKGAQQVKKMSVHQRDKMARFSQTVMLPVNSAEFLNKTHLKPEELFFHKYFSSVAQQASKSASIQNKKSLKKDEKRKKKEEADNEVEEVDDVEFDEFIASDVGQKEIDSQLNYSDHVYKNKNSIEALDEEVIMDDDDDEDDDDEDISFDEGDLEDEDDDEEIVFTEADLLDEEADDVEGGFGSLDDELMEAGSFADVGDDDEEEDEEEPKAKKMKQNSNKQVKKSKKNKSAKKSTSAESDEMITDQINDMFTANTLDDVNTIGSSAIVNRRGSSAKQLKYEQKMMERDVVAAKKQWKNKQNRKAGRARK